MTEQVRKGAGDSIIVPWAHRLGLLTLGLIGVIACCGWLWQFARDSQYWRGSYLTTAPAYLQTQGNATLDQALVWLAIVALLTAWYWLFPRSIRFAIFALAAFSIAFEIIILMSKPSIGFWEVIGLLLAAALILSSLFVIPVREYWRGTTSTQRTLVLSLFLAVMANLLLVVFASVEGSSPYELGAALIISLVIWPLFSCSKLGWLLALLLSAAEMAAAATGELTLNDSLLVALFPALIIILLLLPPVFRWYFPRKDAPAEAADG